MKRVRTLAFPCSVVAALLAGACDTTDDAPATERAAQQTAVEGPKDIASLPYLEGELGAQIADYFDGTDPDKFWGIQIGEDFYRFESREQPDAELGSKIRVHGDIIEHSTGKLVRTRKLEVLAPPPEAIIDPDPLPNRTVGMILVHWNQPDDLTVEAAEQAMIEGPTSLNAYYYENSWGKETFVGGVHGWYQIANPGGCNSNGIASAARSAAQADGVDLSQYNQLLYYFPNYSSCGWAGLGQVGSPSNPARDTWYNGWAACVVLVQEPGHNFGMMHSKSWICSEGSTRVELSDDCEMFEYGNVFCPIGYGPCGHMAPFQKNFMGYFDDCNYVTTGVSGKYNLAPTEIPCNGIQGLRFPRGGGEYYVIDYRQPYGFDGAGTPGKSSAQYDFWPDGLSGITVTVESDEISYLLDMTPGSRGGGGSLFDQDHVDGLMHAGDSYTDPDGTVTITVVSESPTNAVIQLDFASEGAAPVCLDDAVLPMVGDAYGVIECVTDGNMPPTVAITGPADGATFATGVDIPVAATAMDDTAVTQVELQVDGTPVQTPDTAAPYEWTLSGLAAGQYVLTAVASDGTLTATSTAVTITIQDDGGTSSSSSTTDATTTSSTSTTDATTTSSTSTTDATTTSSTSTTDATTTSSTSTTDATTTSSTSSTSGSDTGTSVGTTGDTTTVTTTVATSSTTVDPTMTTTMSGSGTGGIGDDDEGCGCTTGNASGSAWMLLGLLGLARRRRRVHA